jgi:hypothetical protein
MLLYELIGGDAETPVQRGTSNPGSTAVHCKAIGQQLALNKFTSAPRIAARTVSGI